MNHPHLIVYFHPDEKNYPTDASEYLKQVTMIGDTPTYRGPLTEPFDPNAPIYYRVKKDGSVQYWLCYRYNDGQSCFSCCTCFGSECNGSHIADLEHFTLHHEEGWMYLGSHGRKEGSHHKLNKLQDSAASETIRISVALGSHGFYKTEDGGENVICRLCGVANDRISDRGIAWVPTKYIELKDDMDIVMHDKDWGQEGVSALKKRPYWDGPEPSYSRKPADCCTYPFVLFLDFLKKKWC